MTNQLFFTIKIKHSTNGRVAKNLSTDAKKIVDGKDVDVTCHFVFFVVNYK